MHVLWTLLIVATLPTAPIEGDRTAAGVVFSCGFDGPWDENFDGWPDGWTRRRGPGFPRYLSVEIRQEPTPSDDRCLRIDLDGGGAAAYSPAIPVRSVYSYVVDALVRTEGIEHSRAFLSLTLLDEGRQRLETFTSEKIHQPGGWKRIELGPIVPELADARLAVLGLHLEPGTRADLRGTARFDDVRLCRTPRVTLSADSPLGVYTVPHPVAVTCDVSGFTDPEATLTFSLLDAEGLTIAESREPLACGEAGSDRWKGTVPFSLREKRDSPLREKRDSPHRSVEGDSPVFAARETGQSPARETGQSPGLVGSAVWRPPVPGPGFYRIGAVLNVRDGNPSSRAETTLAVIEPQTQPASREFGWTLPQGGRGLPSGRLVRLIEASGVGRVKVPLWLDAAEEGGPFDEALRLSRELADRGIELVGILDNPPLDVPDRFDTARPPLCAEVFSAPADLWAPSLEAVMARMATRVRRWQLGSDTDKSFVGYPRLAEKIARIKAELDRVAYDVQLGFGWDWAAGLPPETGDATPWRFVAVSADPALAPDRLAEHLRSARRSATERWVVLKPLAGSHPTEERAADLVRRMIAAKTHGAEGIFVPNVFADEHGLFRDDGTPGELWLPWRTTALMLAGARPVGSVQLPGGSANRLFARGEEVTMVLWNTAPTEEAIYLGPEARQIDVWGRTHSVSTGELGRGTDCQSVLRCEAGPVPTFVVGVDGRVARWRQGFELADTRLPSVLGRPHRTELRFTNPSDRDVEGVLTLSAPDTWRIEPEQVRFQLGAGEQLRQPLTITLVYDATAGRHPIRGEFDLRGDPPLVFSAYRQVDVGLGDVTVELTTRLNSQGELEVRQRLSNHTEEPVSFRCHLSAPQRRRLRTEVLELGTEADVKTYRLPDGSALVGGTLRLRVEELGGDRVLNYRFTAEP